MVFFYFNNLTIVIKIFSIFAFLKILLIRFLYFMSLIWSIEIVNIITIRWFFHDFFSICVKFLIVSTRLIFWIFFVVFWLITYANVSILRKKFWEILIIVKSTTLNVITFMFLTICEIFENSILTLLTFLKFSNLITMMMMMIINFSTFWLILIKNNKINFSNLFKIRFNFFGILTILICWWNFLILNFLSIN